MDMEGWNNEMGRKEEKRVNFTLKKTNLIVMFNPSLSALAISYIYNGLFFCSYILNVHIRIYNLLTWIYVNLSKFIFTARIAQSVIATGYGLDDQEGREFECR
jgi:hypothetical protein